MARGRNQNGDIMQMADINNHNNTHNQYHNNKNEAAYIQNYIRDSPAKNSYNVSQSDRARYLEHCTNSTNTFS